MNISLNWLTDYVDVAMPATGLAELLTRIGLNCEEIIETETDIVLDVEVTSNRPDCLGHLGVAREVAAATGAEFRPPARPEPETSGQAAELTSVEVREPELCPRYTARVLRGVKVGPSPSWMVERLQSVGLRSVNNVVDATNYVLMEYSQPLHSFDYDKLAENRIVVRRGRPGETIVSIDETECRLDENMLVIADAEQAVAVAGVMGGLNTEVDEHTTNVLIEAARFDPLTTRRTSRTLRLMSESNYRFERGVDPVAIDDASLRACDLIIQTGGGELAGGMVDVWAHPWQPRQVALRPARANALLGLDVPADRQAEMLERLGLSPETDGERIVCTIPAWRADLVREADLIEEIARLEGYDKIPVGRQVAHEVTGEHLPQKVRRQAEIVLAGSGFDEAITFTFVDAEEGRLFGFAEPVCVDPLTRRTNNALRPTLIPSLLRACKSNQDAGNAEVSLYELASVFPPSQGDSPLPGEYVELGMVTTRELRDLRGAVESLVARVAPEAALTVAQVQAPGYEESAAAEIRIDGERAGTLGMLDADVQGHYGLEHRVAAAAICFDAVQDRAGRTRTYQPLAKFPPVERDLSVIVDEEVTWRQLSEVIENVDQPTRRAIEYVTTYRGKPVPSGRKSVTVRVTYRSDAETLRSEQVDEQVGEVVDALCRKLRAELRK